VFSTPLVSAESGQGVEVERPGDGGFRRNKNKLVN